MSNHGRWQRSGLQFARRWLLLCIFALSIVANPGLAHATEGDDRGAADIPAVAIAPPLPGGTIEASLMRPVQRPPLPFNAAQIGPQIKRTFGDDIERRTTAFFATGPLDLSHLTPVKVPPG
ncbi:MAG: hypothetical protein IPK16_17055 [Anaerolineales bacterium]|nr:hypothetical protein [Anaerolineales bacterium]